MTRDQFEVRMTWLKELWPSRKLSAVQVAEWWRVFQHHSDPAFHASLQRYIESSTYDRAPAIGQIVAIIDQLREEQNTAFNPPPLPAHDHPSGLLTTYRMQVLMGNAIDLLWTLRDLGGVEVRTTSCGTLDVEQWRQAGRPATWCVWTDRIMDIYDRHLRHPAGIERDMDALCHALREALRRAAGGGRPEVPPSPDSEEPAMDTAVTVESERVVHEPGRTPRDFRELGDW